MRWSDNLLLVLPLLMLSFVLPPGALSQVVTTTVQGTVYRADGGAASGTLIVSWPTFSTAANQAVAAGSTTVGIGQDGFMSINLAANQGASPAGSYYTATYHLSDGTVSREYWVVPAAATASITSVRAQLEPPTVAVQSATKQYVDSSVASITSSYLPVNGGTMSGPLLLNSDPSALDQAATKRYTDAAVATAVQRSGDTMSGPLKTPNTMNKLPRVDVRHPDFAGGADPTGANDSTAAFQSAITFALANPQQAGGTNYPVIYCAPGHYKINGTLRLMDYMHLVGDGIGTCVLEETNPTANLITVYPPSTGVGVIDPGSIEGVMLEGNGQQTVGTLLEVDDSAAFSINDVMMFNNGGRGLVLNSHSERFLSRNLKIDHVRWPIVMSADENESYFFNTQITTPAAAVNTTNGNDYCYSINCVNGVYPGPNGSSGGAATPVSPDTHAAVYVGSSVNFRFLGGSIKPLKYAAGIQVFNGDVANISNFYFEGYPSDNAPRLNAGIIEGGASVITTLSSGIGATAILAPVASTAWEPAYYNDPRDLPPDPDEPSKQPYVILPQDYLSGSTAPSTYVPGVERGQYEMISIQGFTGDGNVHIAQRNVNGSTAPANTAWPTGSILEQAPTKYGAYGPLTIAQSHFNAIQPPQSGYTDNCNQTNTLTCAEIIAGYEPDGYWIDQTGAFNSNLNANLILNGDSLFNSSYPHMGEIATHDIAAITINGAGYFSTGETSEVTNGPLRFNIGASTGGSFITAPLYATGQPAQVTLSIPSSHGTWSSRQAFYAQEAHEPNQGGYGPGNWMNGTQFANQYCWFDVPGSGTQSSGRFCMNGGPGNTGNKGFEYDVWNGSAWVGAFDVKGQGNATATVSLNGSMGIQGSLNSAVLNGEVTVDGATYTTLNAAWNAAAALASQTGQNQTVRLGPGTYPVTATMNEPANGACVNVIGSGGSASGADTTQTATTLKVVGSLGGDLFFEGNTAQAQGCTFKDLNILANMDAAHGFEFQWFRSLLLDNVAVNDTTAEGILLGEETTSGGHQAGFLMRNVTVSYSASAFAPVSRPAYGIHLAKTAIDSHMDTVLIRNALTAAVFNEGTGNTGYMVHGFGYPYTCTTGPCSNSAPSGTAANASYATSYVIYDTGGGGSVWTDTYADSPSVAAFYIGANGVSVHGGHVQWPELTSFPSANFAYVTSAVTNNLLIGDVDCLGMSPSVNWITYEGSSGIPPTFTSIHHLTGCGNYYQALEPATTTGYSSGGTNVNDASGAEPRVWASPLAAAANYTAYAAQMYTGYQGDVFNAHFSGLNPFFNITYQGTIRSQGGIALSMVINTASTLTLTAANKNVIANAVNGAQTITLPSCYTPLPDKATPTGLEFTIIKSDASANAVTLNTTSSQNINYHGVVAQTLAITSAGERSLICGPDYNWYAY